MGLGLRKPCNHLIINQPKIQPRGRDKKCSFTLFLLRLGFRKRGIGNSYEVVEKNSGRIAVFAHQGFGLHWLSYLTKIPYHILTASFDISHTGVTIIHFDESGEVTYPTVLTLSDLSHIYKEGLPLKYHNSIEI